MQVGRKSGAGSVTGIFSPARGDHSQTKRERFEAAPEYWRVAIRNLQRAERESHEMTLFDLLPVEQAA